MAGLIGCTAKSYVKKGEIEKTITQQAEASRYIEALGIGAADSTLTNTTQRRATSRDAAIVQAQYEMLSYVKGVQLEGGITVEKAMETDSKLESYLKESSRVRRSSKTNGPTMTAASSPCGWIKRNFRTAGSNSSHDAKAWTPLSWRLRPSLWPAARRRALQKAKNEEGEIVVAEGIAPYKADDLPGTKAASLAAAQRSAVELVVGVYVNAKTRVEKAVAIEQSILAKTSGYVKRYEILSQGRDGEWYKTKIRALVSTQQLHQDLDTLGLLKTAGRGIPARR